VAGSIDGFLLVRGANVPAAPFGGQAVVQKVKQTAVIDKFIVNSFASNYS
jgi:hypothetical protein